MKLPKEKKNKQTIKPENFFKFRKNCPMCGFSNEHTYDFDVKELWFRSCETCYQCHHLTLKKYRVQSEAEIDKLHHKFCEWQTQRVAKCGNVPEVSPLRLMLAVLNMKEDDLAMWIEDEYETLFKSEGKIATKHIGQKDNYETVDDYYSNKMEEEYAKRNKSTN